jgi:dihydrofolate synthase/folylpolyglutamate synthase
MHLCVELIISEYGMDMNIEEAYQQSLEYLYSFIDYSMTRAFRYSSENFDLTRMEALLQILGNPHDDYVVIHVAGSKGKGSTAAMIASAVQAGGYRVGFYTSPHLQDYTERMRIDGELISKADFVALVEEMKPAIDKVPRVTTFEITTAMAFLYFKQQNVDLAVVEVGLGGRLDATNLVEPLVAVITSLSYEHTHILGNTLTEIATEKAGIIKPNRPVVLAPQKDEARLVIERIANERNAALTQVGKDYLFAPGEHSLDGQSLLIWPAEDQARFDQYIESPGDGDWQPVRLTIPLLGQHQIENAATAYAAIQVARNHGLRVREDDIRRGFASVFWPGRFEVLRRDPPVIIDSAHNRDAGLKLRLTIDDYLDGLPVILIFGASEDKDIQGIFSELLPRVRYVICTESFHPRALEAEKLVKLVHQFGLPARIERPVEQALQEALDMAGHESVVLAAGSVFIAAAVRECWHKAGYPINEFPGNHR